MVRPGFKTAAALLGVLLVLALPWLEHERLIVESEIALAHFRDNLFVALATLYLTAFMAILMLRYIALIICSYLEYLRRQAENDTPTNDSSLPLISIVVPAYNEGPVIVPALRALLELDYPNYEIIVVDDGSTDDTYERALGVARASHSVAIRVVAKRNGGKADALNTGMAYARGDFIFNMDGDTKLSRNTLRACIRHFADERVGAVAGNVKVLNRENTLTCLQALEYVEGLAMVRRAQSLFNAVSIVPGPAGLFRKSALMQARGYDRDTFAEDCDLTLKLLMLGWHVTYEPKALAWVETPSGLLDLIKQRYRWVRGILQAIRKNRAALHRPREHGINFWVLWYMVFESIIWPVSTVFGSVFFAYVAFAHGMAAYLLFWWLQLTLLDIVAATYCVVLENEDVSLLAYAPLFRIFYVVTLDVAKVLASVAEFRGLGMTWGKLERQGKL